MIRLSDFITKIRNCKTMAQQRAETQKEMAAIRESFSKNQQNLRLRNVTKLLFINMMGQDTDFGQMECLKLITASTFIQKRIGYLGLTQLFHQRSELLMMATHRLRIDLTSGNNYIVGLTLSVLSEICTPEHAKQLAPEIVKLVGNSSNYIKKKAILTATKIIRKSPQFIPEFIQKIETVLDDKQHGVLLGVMGLLETSLLIDQSHAPRLAKLIPRLTRVYKSVLSNHSPQYEISGTNDPFLQVAILKFMRLLLKYQKSISSQVTAILLQVHQFISSKHSATLKNGANAVLFQCFQLMIILQPTAQLKQMIASLVSKFVSVKDSNSKYLTLYTLNLLSKYDINSVQNHRNTIYDCLSENDILVRVMALDLLYLIANQDNVVHIIKDLLNTLLNANDEEFITQLSLKICLIVDKQSPSRRWHFDTILKVLILAGHAVKQQSISSLVHLITSTPQLQTYAMIKLFFASSQNTSNQTLSKIVLYLLGEFGQILLQAKQVNVNQDNILTLIQNIILRVGVSDDTISYGLSSLFKLAEKTRQKFRILGVIKSFENNSSVQVQKRACQYSKLLDSEWDSDRKKEICIPIPILTSAVQVFKPIPIGSTEVTLDNPNLIMPEKKTVIKPQPVANRQQQEPQRQQIPTKIRQNPIQNVIPVKAPVNIFDFDQEVPPVITPVVTPIITQQPIQQIQPKQPEKNQLNLFDNIFFNSEVPKVQQPSIPTYPNPINQNQPLGFNLLTNIQQPIQNYNPQGFNNNPQGFGNNLLNNQSLTNKPPVQNTGGFNLLGESIGQKPVTNFTFNSVNPSPPPVNLLNNNFLTQTQSQTTNNNSLNLLGFQPPQQQVQSFGTLSNNSSTSFRAYQNQHIQIVFNCNKQSADTANIVAIFNNKTKSLIENLTLQVAVMKHLKLTMNPLNTTRLDPLSRDTVNQKMKLVNSTVGQKGIVMKIKLIYNINGEKITEEGKISNFPQGY